MKFKGTPNMYIKISNKLVKRVSGIKGFHFDDKGEYESENELLIRVLSQNFEQCTDNEENKKHCKKCDFTCDSQGVLLAHYRENHPKEGK
jgi:hypothetical protein